MRSPTDVASLLAALALGAGLATPAPASPAPRRRHAVVTTCLKKHDGRFQDVGIRRRRVLVRASLAAAIESAMEAARKSCHGPKRRAALVRADTLDRARGAASGPAPSAAGRSQ